MVRYLKRPYFILKATYGAETDGAANKGFWTVCGDIHTKPWRTHIQHTQECIKKWNIYVTYWLDSGSSVQMLDFYFIKRNGFKHHPVRKREREHMSRKGMEITATEHILKSIAFQKGD